MMQQDSRAWVSYTYVAFAVALGLTLAGILWLPIGLAERGYLLMGIFFLVGSTVTLTKTIRDQHESDRLVHRLEQAKAEKLLHEYDAAA